MPERHPLEPLFSCLLSSQGVNDMLGDLAEERRNGFLWAFLAVPSSLIALWKERLVQSPCFSLLLASGTLSLAALVYCFLLIPFTLVHIDVQLLPLMVVLFLLRALSCFTVAIVLADAFGRKASAGFMLAAVMMPVIGVLRVYAQFQGWWLLTASELQGPAQHLLFYALCSALPLVAGCIYGLGCRHQRYSECLQEPQ